MSVGFKSAKAFYIARCRILGRDNEISFCVLSAFAMHLMLSLRSTQLRCCFCTIAASILKIMFFYQV
jgi:hypothetical protein